MVNDKKKRRVVITGIGLVSPCGNGREESWRNVQAGKSGIDQITLFDVGHFPCQIAGEVKTFSLDSILEKKGEEINEYISRGSRFGIGASYEAMEDAGLAKDTLTRDSDIEARRVGVVFGNSGTRPLLAEMRPYVDAFRTNFAHMPFISIADYLKNKHHTCAELISILHNAKGCNYPISTACASGTQALGLGYRMVQEDRADIIIAGGSDSMINEIELMGFCTIGAVTSSFNETPQKASRPFSRSRSGFVLGEGGAVLILEELQHALGRNAKIYAEIVGFGNTLSGYNMTDLPPDGSGASSSMERALQDAGVQPEDIGYINAHGTSTKDNDRVETLSIKKTFGDRAYKIPISSTKSCTAHMISAAGAIEASFCALAIRDHVLPPTINLDDPDGQCDLDYIPNIKRKRKIEYALSNSLGFGGSNCTIILKRFQE